MHIFLFRISPEHILAKFYVVFSVSSDNINLVFKIIKILYFVVEPATSRTLGYLCPDLVRKMKYKDGILLN